MFTLDFAVKPPILMTLVLLDRSGPTLYINTKHLPVAFHFAANRWDAGAKLIGIIYCVDIFCLKLRELSEKTTLNFWVFNPNNELVSQISRYVPLPMLKSANTWYVITKATLKRVVTVLGFRKISGSSTEVWPIIRVPNLRVTKCYKIEGLILPTFSIIVVTFFRGGGG